MKTNLLLCCWISLIAHPIVIFYRNFNIMGLKEMAEQKAEEKIFEEGGYTALWKYKIARMMNSCGCM